MSFYIAASETRSPLQNPPIYRQVNIFPLAKNILTFAIKILSLDGGELKSLKTSEQLKTNLCMFSVFDLALKRKPKKLSMKAGSVNVTLVLN